MPAASAAGGKQAATYGRNRTGIQLSFESVSLLVSLTVEWIFPSLKRKFASDGLLGRLGSNPVRASISGGKEIRISLTGAVPLPMSGDLRQSIPIFDFLHCSLGFLRSYRDLSQCISYIICC